MTIGEPFNSVNLVDMGILKKASKSPEEKAMNVSLPRKTHQFTIQNQNESLREMFIFRNSCMEVDSEEERKRCCKKPHHFPPEKKFI